MGGVRYFYLGIIVMLAGILAVLSGWPWTGLLAGAAGTILFVYGAEKG